MSSIPMDEVGVGNDGFVWVIVGGWKIHSCYWSPNTPYANYEDFLHRLESRLHNSSANVLVARDFNAKHCAWSSPTNDSKGKALADMAQNA